MRLDLAAQEIAEAIRYARSESLRTGEIHGIEISQNTQRVVVYKADLATTPVGMASILYHPVAKQPFDFDVATRPTTAGVNITNARISFSTRRDGARTCCSTPRACRSGL